VSETVTLNDLSNNDVFLIKVNKSANTIAAANTGQAFSLTGSDVSGGGPSEAPRIAPRADTLADGPGYHHYLPAQEFNANPPPITDAVRRQSAGNRAVIAAPQTGDTRTFWVERIIDTSIWVQKQATLRAAGTYGNVWVMDDCYNNSSVISTDKKITSAQAQELSDKFDLIYPAETNLLGYEYGGGPQGDGGRDGDPTVEILVYNIGSGLSASSASVVGFFWAKDFYPQNQLPPSYKTNLAEIFYLAVNWVDAKPDIVYSTLVHEFQHMINFNRKYVQNSQSSPTWYDEMLSLMAEDVIGPLAGISSTENGHPIQERIPIFLSYYDASGITEWQSDSDVLKSYANTYAFGAYLMRNWGGAELLKNILANGSAGTTSITTALNSIENGMSFAKALSRYGEALVFNNSYIGIVSFDNTVTKTIGPYTYTADAFDVWNKKRHESLLTGPEIYDLSQQSMRPYSIRLHRSDGWSKVAGSLTIELTKPNDPNIEFYIMIK
jgi:hypothetical protein